MAADDIYMGQVHFEGPTSAASIVLHYQETIAHTTPQHGTSALAEALDDQLSAAFIAVLSDDWRITAYVSRLLNVNVENKRRFDVVGGVGTRTGPSLPANQTWMLKQSQTLFGPKSNGRMFVPGLAEGDTTVGVITNAFATGPAAALATALTASITELSAGTGVWTPGVISAKVLNAAPPAKDWAGAFSPVSIVTPWTIIAHQRRRKTPVIGAFQ